MKNCSLLGLLLMICTIAYSQSALNNADFITPPRSSQVHAWWHWISGNITKDGITKDLESMKQQGITQVTILNVGGFVSAKLNIPSIKFDSPEWFDMFKFSLKEANRLGLTLGVHNSDGWSTSGGPWISAEMSMKTYAWSKTYFDGGKQVNIQLEQPPAINNFYREFAAVAFPVKADLNSFVKSSPIISLNNVDTKALFFDGNPKSEKTVQKGDVLNIAFKAAFTTNKIALLAHLPFSWSDMNKIETKFVLSASNDGKTFLKISDLDFIGINKIITVDFPSTTARFFKLECIANDDNSPIAELELLKSNDEPSYAPAISNLLEKTVSVSSSSESKFDRSPQISKNSIDSNAMIVLTNFVSKDGVLKWKAPKGRWAIIRFGYTTTGITNSPATPEGQGLECDKMDSLALKTHFNSFAKKLIEAAGKYNGNTFKFLLIDSWEAQFQNWTKEFPAEFKNRRGYDLIKWLPVLCGETIENTKISEAFLHDFRKTIADLIDQNYYKQFSRLCHQNQLEMHAEVIYGGGSMYPPLDILKSTQYVDLPMTEFWASPNQYQIPEYFPADRPTPYYPAYSNLAYNKRIIGSEAYTGFAHFSESPANLKPFGDLAYCSGVNQLILHSYVHQPNDRVPVVTLGKFAAHFNRNNPWWNFAKDWLTYQSRVQYVLQKGKPAVDVLFYVGDNFPQNLEKSVISDLPSGYRANPINLDLLLNAKVVGNKISIGGKETYPLLTLPDRTSMDLLTLKKIAELVKDGATVYGKKPTEMLSVLDIENHQEEFDKIVHFLWGKTCSEENKYGKGKVFCKKNITDVLNVLNVKPDFTFNGFDSKDLMFIHKKLEDAEVYFVFNQKNKSLNKELLFRVEGKIPEIWNPKDGSIVKPKIYSIEQEQMRIPISFEPGESLIFVFKEGISSHVIKSVSLAQKQIFPAPNSNFTNFCIPKANYNNGKYSFTSTVNGRYQFTTDKNEVIEGLLIKPSEFEITNYKAFLEFSPVSKDSIHSVEISHLRSLTEFEQPAIKYFAGNVNYSISFELPANYYSRNDSLILNLGYLDATAEVRLNGILLGHVWSPNTKFDVSGCLKKKNTLNIVLATVLRNRFIGDFVEFGAVRNIPTTSPIQTILNKDMPLQRSGLMGPLTIIKFKNKKEVIYSLK